MSQRVIHSMDIPWTSSNGVVLSSILDSTDHFVEGIGSNFLRARAGAIGERIEYVPLAPLDLREYDELRFWIRGDRSADGGARAPFLLEFSYVDSGDLPGEVHRWLVPINRGNSWEQRRIGIENDRRSAINRFQFRCLVDGPFNTRIDNLLAVRPEMLPDVENALATKLSADNAFPLLNNLPIQAQVNPGGTQVIVPLTSELRAGNRIALRGGTFGEEIHDLQSVTHTTSTTLVLQHGVNGTFVLGVGTVSLLAPVVLEAPPVTVSGPVPCIYITNVEVKEDLDRTGYFLQQDSFRLRGAGIVCGQRPAPRAYTADYQIIAVAPDREQQRLLYQMVLRNLSIDLPLHISGYLTSMFMLPAPAVFERMRGIAAPIYVRVNTQMDVAPRVERPWVRRVRVEAARLDTPQDEEGITINL